MPSIFDPLQPMSRAEHETAERQQRSVSRRLIGFRVAVVIAFAVLAGKLWDMQIVHSQNYVTEATQNRVRERTVKALRGVIYDRNGKQLVSNEASFDIAIDVEDLPSKDQAPVIDRLAKLLKADPAQISAKVDNQRKTSPTVPVTVATSVAWDTLLQIKQDHVNLPGVLPVQSTIRDYLDGPLLAGILGYIGPITEEEYPKLKDQGYEQDDKIGEAGVELTYEDQLRGVNGLQHVEVDAGGREVQVLDEVPPKPGSSLQLTIDESLQKDVNTYLQWGLDRAHCFDDDPNAAAWTSLCPADVRAKMAKPAVDGGHGNEAAAIVLDVHTGDVLAMAGFPQYDDNAFSGRPEDQAKAAAILTDHANPLINRALSATEPGSTFKQITASAALQEHIVTPTSGISVGACWGGGIAFCNWESRGYSNMTVVDAIAQSNDIWMATVVAGNGLIPGMGVDKLAWYAKQFGLGHQLGIDLPFEQKGLVGDTAWKVANFANDPDQNHWIFSDTLYEAIGQGYVDATPLQMASVAAAVANGGNVMKPHVVKAIVDSQGHVIKNIDPQVENKVPVDPKFLEVVRQGMRQGVIHGSSVAGDLHEVQIAAKTGTAEFVEMGPDGKPVRDKEGHLPTNAWWVAFAPYDNPQVAIAVWVHDAGEGAAFAVPVGRKILARYFHVSDIRNPWGCDTMQTTPSYCSEYLPWVRGKVVYNGDPIQRESVAEDFHDPSFPLPKDLPPDVVAALTPKPSAPAKPA